MTAAAEDHERDVRDAAGLHNVPSGRRSFIGRYTIEKNFICHGPGEEGEKAVLRNANMIPASLLEETSGVCMQQRAPAFTLAKHRSVQSPSAGPLSVTQTSPGGRNNLTG